MTTPTPTDSPQEVVARWWRTYDAAVSGACANPIQQHAGFDGLHDFAVRLANHAHGVLEPMSTHQARQIPEVAALVEAVQLLLEAYEDHIGEPDLLIAIDACIGPLGNALLPFLTPDTEP